MGGEGEHILTQLSVMFRLTPIKSSASIKCQTKAGLVWILMLRKLLCVLRPRTELHIYVHWDLHYQNLVENSKENQINLVEKMDEDYEEVSSISLQRSAEYNLHGMLY